jgi:hypothetical protein
MHCVVNCGDFLLLFSGVVVVVVVVAVFLFLEPTELVSLRESSFVRIVLKNVSVVEFSELGMQECGFNAKRRRRRRWRRRRRSRLE